MSDAQSSARFRDMQTLKYVLRSIEKNCPWYNKIYLITKGYHPEWLNIDHPKIELISEEDLFIDKSHLPIFSSVAIEMNLVNLKQLSEKFVYLNDDMIIMRKVDSNRFFVDNKPVDFLSHGFIPRNKLFGLLKERDTWIHSLNNTLELINMKFAPISLEKKYLYHKSYSLKDKLSNFLLENIHKKVFWIQHWHHPQAYLKSTLKEVYSTFKNPMMKCSQNKFRDKSNLDQYIYRYWQLFQGNFHPYKNNDGIISNLDTFKTLKKLIINIESQENINFVCFNDSTLLSDSEYEKVKNTLLTYLESKFPDKASFEQ